MLSASRLFNHLVLLLVVLGVSSCASMRSGQHVYWEPGRSLDKVAHHSGTTPKELKKLNPNARPGQWLFVPNKVGFLPFLKDTVLVEDYSALGKGEYGWPVPNYPRISSHFGQRWGRRHEGIDIPAPRGTPAVAVAAGVVKYSDNRMRGYGNMIIIEHPGKIYSVYAHNSKNLVRSGQKVKRGQMIAKIGRTGHATGSHLHFEIRYRDQARDPASFLGHVSR